MRSMTGYGRGEAENAQLKIMVEAKAVNHRYSELVIKQPRGFMALEDQIKKKVGQYIERGRMEIYIRFQETGVAPKMVEIDQERGIAYHEGLKNLAQRLNEPYQLDIYRLAALPEVILEQEREADLQIVWPLLEDALTMALGDHVAMRLREGEAIKADLLAKIEGITSLTGKIAERSPLVLLESKEKLKMRIAELLEGAAIVNEERLAQEVAYFAEKSCIDEELVRLDSHFKQFTKIIDEKGSIGRKLDFLIQEMNRETNTIGSKAGDLLIGQFVVEMKSELEKIREQVQNIE